MQSPITPPPTPRLKKSYAAGSYSTITLTSEIGEGSTGKVHGGTLTVNAGSEYVDLNVVVKISFGEEEKERLRHEYLIYHHLYAHNVKGIPISLGLYDDPEVQTSALVTLHAGRSIYKRTMELEYFQR